MIYIIAKFNALSEIFDVVGSYKTSITNRYTRYLRDLDRYHFGSFYFLMVKNLVSIQMFKSTPNEIKILYIKEVLYA